MKYYHFWLLLLIIIIIIINVVLIINFERRSLLRTEAGQNSYLDDLLSLEPPPVAVST